MAVKQVPVSTIISRDGGRVDGQWNAIEWNGSESDGCRSARPIRPPLEIHIRRHARESARTRHSASRLTLADASHRAAIIAYLRWSLHSRFGRALLRLQRMRPARIEARWKRRASMRPVEPPLKIQPQRAAMHCSEYITMRLTDRSVSDRRVQCECCVRAWLAALLTSFRMAWSTAQPEWRCGSMYDMAVSGKRKQTTESLASGKSRRRCALLWSGSRWSRRTRSFRIGQRSQLLSYRHQNSINKSTIKWFNFVCRF